MKPLVHVTHIAGSAEWAGGETYLLYLARRLNRQRIRLSVICPAGGPLVEMLEQEGIATEIIDLSRLVSAKAVQGLVRALRHGRPDILQSHGARANFYGRLAGRLAGVPRIVSTVHNSLYDYPVSSPRKALYLLLDRLTSSWVDSVLCVARALARDLILRSKLPPRKVAVIHNGVDVQRFHPLAGNREGVRRELGLNSQPALGVIGRMTPQKGHEFFLQGMAAITKVFPQVKAVMVGDGPLRPQLEELARALGVRDHCIFCGVRQDMPEILSALDMVVVPSLSEGMPYVLLEAMAMAKPVVATQVNGIPEVVEEGRTGLLVSPRDALALAAAIISLLHNPLCAREMGSMARKAVADRFSLERMITEIEGFYGDLLNGGNISRFCLLPAGPKV